MKVECPRCHTHVEKPLHGDPICPTCGFGAPEGDGTGAAAQPPPEPSPAASNPTSSTAGETGGLSPAGWEHTGTPAPGAQKQGLAITALVLGILGCCVFGLLTAIPAIIVGIIALKKIKEEPQTYGGHGMAMAGLILGIIGTVVSIIIIIFYGVLIAAVFDCEENPDSEFCRQLEEEGGSPQEAVQPSITPAWNNGLMMAVAPWLQRRPWHAG